MCRVCVFSLFPLFSCFSTQSAKAEDVCTWNCFCSLKICIHKICIHIVVHVPVEKGILRVVILFLFICFCTLFLGMQPIVRASRSRSRSPGRTSDREQPLAHEITRGTYWGLYSEAEAKRRKTEEYYDQMRQEEEEINRTQQEFLNKSRAASPKAKAPQVREDLYRKLRG